MESKERAVRKDAFTTLYAAYNKQINTWGAMLNASVKADVFAKVGVIAPLLRPL